MKNLLKLILILQIGSLNAQEISPKLLSGTWRFESEIDLRTEKEKSEYVEPCINYIETENGTRGHPDITFKKNRKFERYFNKNYVEYGKFEITKNQTLILWKKCPMKTMKDKIIANAYLEQGKIFRREDGRFYFKYTIEYKIKSVSKNQIEFITSRGYSIWKRIK